MLLIFPEEQSSKVTVRLVTKAFEKILANYKKSKGFLAWSGKKIALKTAPKNKNSDKNNCGADFSQCSL